MGQDGPENRDVPGKKFIRTKQKFVKELRKEIKIHFNKIVNLFSSTTRIRTGKNSWKIINAPFCPTAPFHPGCVRTDLSTDPATRTETVCAWKIIIKIKTRLCSEVPCLESGVKTKKKKKKKITTPRCNVTSLAFHSFFQRRANERFSTVLRE